MCSGSKARWNARADAGSARGRLHRRSRRCRLCCRRHTAAAAVALCPLPPLPSTQPSPCPRYMRFCQVVQGGGADEAERLHGELLALLYSIQFHMQASSVCVSQAAGLGRFAGCMQYVAGALQRHNAGLLHAA